jgi:transcriptional regulator with XRE-family HTH domain
VAARFAANLVRERKRAGLTQEDVSWRAAVHRTEVSVLERGLRVPRIDTLIKLAGSLEVTADELLDGLEWKPGSFRPGRFGVPKPEVHKQKSL